MAADWGDTIANDLLKLLLQGTAIADLAENDATSPLTNLYLSLHTATPATSGDQTTSEISYTGYARVAVARSAVGFTISGKTVALAATATFGEMTAGAGGTVTYAILGTASSGTGKILFRGAVSPQIVVSNGVIPKLSPAVIFTVE
jgi:hypothetical protein